MSQHEAQKPNILGKPMDLGGDGKTRKSKVSDSAAVDYFDVDEALANLKSIFSNASDFLQRRPLLMFGGACALGLIGTLALSMRRRED